MTYQANLFSLDVMQDRSGRLNDYPAPPATYGDCLKTKHLRQLPADDPRAERCQCLGCPHNLTAEIGRLKNEESAIKAMVEKYESGTWDTCALDVAEDFVDDAVIGRLIGVPRQMVAQTAANAAFRFRKAYQLESRILESTERRTVNCPDAPPLKRPADQLTELGERYGGKR